MMCHAPNGDNETASAEGLAELLSPVQVADFFNDFWEKKALYLPRKDPRLYQSLFSLEDFDSLLSHTAPRFPEIRVIHKDDPQASDEMFGAGWAESWKEARVSGLYQLYERGGTIQIHNMQNRWQPIASLCRQLEASLHYRVNANAYLCAANAHGFRAHYDSYDAFVLQVYGSKPWQVYEPSHQLPLEDRDNDTGIAGTMPEGDACSLVYDVSLQAGDLLYLPRGWCHAAGVSASPSLYLAIMVHVYRWKDLMVQALEELSEADVRFRKALPIGFAHPTGWSSDDDSYFEELLSALRDKARLEPARKRLARSFFGSLQPVADGHFAHIGNVANITAHTVVEKRPGGLCHVASSAGQATIYFPGDQVSGPLRIEPSLQFIAGAMGPFTCNDLPGPLNDAGKLVLIRRLISAGLLRFATCEPELTV